MQGQKTHLALLSTPVLSLVSVALTIARVALLVLELAAFVKSLDGLSLSGALSLEGIDLVKTPATFVRNQHEGKRGTI